MKRICAGPPEPKLIALQSGNKSSAPTEKIKPSVTVIDYEMSQIPSVSYSEGKPMHDEEGDEEIPSASFTLKAPRRISTANPPPEEQEQQEPPESQPQEQPEQSEQPEQATLNVA